MSRSCCSGRQRTKGIQNSLHCLSFTTRHPASSLPRPSCLCRAGLNIKKTPETLSLICSLAEKTPGGAEQCFPSFALPPRLLCLGWINQLAFSPSSKVSPFRKSSQDKGLPVLASEILDPSPQDWDFPILQMALKPWGAAEKKLGQGVCGRWVHWELCPAPHYPWLWVAGQQDARRDGEVQTIPVLPQGAAGSEALQPLSSSKPILPPSQHLIAPHSILLIRKAVC